MSLIQMGRASELSVWGTPLKTSKDFTPEALGLPSVDEYSANVEEALAAVRTNAQARAAVGTTTQRISDTFRLLADLDDDSDVPTEFLDRMRADLDKANAALAAPYAQIPNDDAPLSSTTPGLSAWFTLTPIIVSAYLTAYLAQLEQRGLDALTPVDFSPISLLSLAIARVGGSATDVIKAAGNAATESIKGAAQAWWPVVLAGGVVLGAFYFVGPAIRRRLS